MELLKSIIIVVQVLVALGIIAFVLLQQGKGADMGAAFGSGSAGSVFGARGSANFLSRTTAVLATIFFICTLSLAVLSSYKPQNSAGVLGQVATPAPTTPNAAPPAAPANGSGPAVPK